MFQLSNMKENISVYNVKFSLKKRISWDGGILAVLSTRSVDISLALRRKEYFNSTYSKKATLCGGPPLVSVSNDRTLLVYLSPHACHCVSFLFACWKGQPITHVPPFSNIPYKVTERLLLKKCNVGRRYFPCFKGWIGIIFITDRLLIH